MTATLVGAGRRPRAPGAPCDLTQSRAVASEFSHPDWWPKPPPRPPTSLSTGRILVGTVVPVVAVAAVLVALLDHRAHHATVVVGRSSAAFTACLDAQGVLVPSAESNDALLRQAAFACRGHAPALAPGNRAAVAQQVLQRCLQAAGSHVRDGFRPGPFGGGPDRQAYESATAICRAQAFAEAGAGASQTAPTAIA